MDLKQRKDGREAHDAELELAVRQTLGLPSGMGLEQAMEQSGTTTEDLLNTILTQLTPWARMMRDILGMLEAAHGGADTEELSIKVKWDALDEELQVSLDAFRRHVSVIQNAMLTSSGRAWGLFDFNDVYPSNKSDLRYADVPGTSRFGQSSEEHVEEDLRSWLRSLWNGVIDGPPPIRLTADPEFEALLAELRSVVISHMRAVALMHGGRSQGIVDTPEDIELPDEWTISEVSRLHEDRLTALPLVWYAAAPKLLDWPRLRDKVVNHLRTQLKRIPPRQEKWIKAAQALEDVLDLPIWRKRHELYSVWVATQIASFSGRAHDWILTDGVLSFSFAGADVARFQLSGGTALLRAENREETDLQLKGSGRKHAVQPDYTVYREHAGQRRDAGLVVECKHYRIAARRSFEHAIWDYTLAHPKARVLLVNYTKIGEITLPSHGTFSEAYGEVRPSGSGMAPFGEQVRYAFVVMDEDSKVLGGKASIQLHWDDGGDLDLHVVRRRGGVRTAVSFSSRGTLFGDPWMELKEDRQSSPASEEVNISKTEGDVFEVYVHRYHGEWPSSQFFVEIESGRGRKCFFPPDEQPGADWWHVCDASIMAWAFTTGSGMHRTAPYLTR
ncbi:hypothetical protein A6R73_01610 [Xanthomonas translucens pv. poae]|uniref:Uncharacterized protein n=1 Tax=Xanthomonas graminis pv. poae TaxID=227946 RepID=A0A199P7E3_9XANT|nr:hypothetical protein A6R73_01610 [Xanthomonas translucens pv. poae]